MAKQPARQGKVTSTPWQNIKICQLCLDLYTSVCLGPVHLSIGPVHLCLDLYTSILDPHTSVWICTLCLGPVHLCLNLYTCQTPVHLRQTCTPLSGTAHLCQGSVHLCLDFYTSVWNCTSLSGTCMYTSVWFCPSLSGTYMSVWTQTWQNSQLHRKLPAFFLPLFTVL